MGKDGIATSLPRPINNKSDQAPISKQQNHSLNAPVAPTDIKIHALADVFPVVEGKEFDELVADIKKNGVRQPITLFEDMILDGRSRYKAALQTGVTPMFTVYTGSDPEAYVISLNVIRRHLTLAQKHTFIEKLLKADPEKSDRFISNTVKVDNKTVGKIRKKLEAGEEIPHTPERKDSKGRKQSAKKTGAKSKGVKASPPKSGNGAPPAKQPKPAVDLKGCAPNVFGARMAEQLRLAGSEHRVAFVAAYGIEELMACADPEKLSAAIANFSAALERQRQKRVH